MTGQERSRTGRVLEMLLRMPGATRPQLCRALDMSPAAMQAAVDQLRAAGAIRQDGFQRSGGGRRAARYRVDPGAARVAGVMVDREGVSAALYDAGLTRQVQARLPFALKGSGPQAGLTAMAEAVNKLMALADGDAGLTGVGVALNGALKGGVVQDLADAPRWRGLDLAGSLGRMLGVRVLAGGACWMELTHLHAAGRVTRPECALLLRVGDSVEAALMVEGQVFEGGHGHPGALGHLPVRRDGIPCACGGAGCLTLYCSQEGMARQYAAQTGGRCASALELMEKMDQGDQAAARTVGQALNYLVEAMSTAALAYDPLEILVDCAFLASRKPLFFKMLDAFYARSQFTRAGNIDVRLVEAPDAALSAASCALAALLPGDPRWAQE